MLKAPYYTIVGARPVKAIRNSDGGLGIYSFNWQTGSFDLDMSYLNRIYGGREDDFEELTEGEFEAYVLDIRKKRGFFDGPS